MEHATVKALLERYWLAETTVEEEKKLADYFRSPGVSPDLEPFRYLFSFFDGEALPSLGDDFENRVLDRMLRPASSQSAFPVVPLPSAFPTRARQPALIRSFQTRNGWMAAAALILAVSLFLVVPSKAPDHAGSSSAGSSSAGSPFAGSRSLYGSHSGADPVANLKDTYEDPRQALAAIQKALLTVSHNMDLGKNITHKQMGRLSDNWRSAIIN